MLSYDDNMLPYAQLLIKKPRLDMRKLLPQVLLEGYLPTECSKIENDQPVQMYLEADQLRCK